jgi:hypothetical protein
MNKKQKLILLIGLALILVSALGWIASGGEVLSKDGVWVEKDQSDLDKLLGLDPEMEFKEQFILGLIPHTALFTFFVTILTGFLIFIFRTKKNEEKNENIT